MHNQKQDSIVTFLTSLRLLAASHEIRANRPQRNYLTFNSNNNNISVLQIYHLKRQILSLGLKRNYIPNNAFYEL